MTTIEKRIFLILETYDNRNQFKLDQIALAYRQGHTASPSVYQKVQWDRLNKEIEKTCGKRALKWVRRYALNQE